MQIFLLTDLHFKAENEAKAPPLSKSLWWKFKIWYNFANTDLSVLTPSLAAGNRALRATLRRVIVATSKKNYYRNNKSGSTYIIQPRECLRNSVKTHFTHLITHVPSQRWCEKHDECWSEGESVMNNCCHNYFSAMRLYSQVQLK